MVGRELRGSCVSASPFITNVMSLNDISTDLSIDSKERCTRGVPVLYWKKRDEETWGL